MPLETLFKAVTAMILRTTPSYFLLYWSDYMDLNMFLSNSLNDPMPFVKIRLCVAAGLQCPLPYASSINPASWVEFHRASVVDSSPASSVCVRSSAGISPEPRHRGLLTQTWPFALNPRIFPRSLSASRQHLRSPSRFTAPWRERRGGQRSGWVGGGEGVALSGSCSHWS